MLSMAALSLTLVSVANTSPSLQNEPAQVNVIDTRPRADMKTKLLSVWITSCNYGVMNIADGDGKEVQPGSSRAMAFERFINDGKFLPETYRGDVELRRFAIFVNGKSYQKGESVRVGFGGGAIAPLVASGKAKGESCPREKMKGGWYNSDELTNQFSPIVVEIEFFFNGYLIAVHKAVSPNRELITGNWLSKLNDKDASDFRARSESC